MAYTNSKLATFSIKSPNHSGTRNHSITRITPHYMCWYTSAATCCQSFLPSNRQASSNYCIGKDGEIALCVDEANRAWTSSSAANDNRAITIECANYMDSSNGHVKGELPKATWNSLVKLCADICKRNGKVKLVFTGSADESKIKSNEMLLTMHKWFADTDCPGPWFSNQFARLAKEVNELLTEKIEQKPGEAVNNANLKYKVYSKDIGWNATVRDGQVAGIVGKSKQIEAFKIAPPKGWELTCKAHISNVGWVTYKGIKAGSKTNPVIGTIGKRIECLILSVAKRPAGDKRKLKFRVHQQSAGWKKWTPEGCASGTDGMSLRIEAIQMKIE